MSRGEMDGRVAEIESGCYYQTCGDSSKLPKMPFCHATYKAVRRPSTDTVDRGAAAGTIVKYGPCCIFPLCCCPCAIDTYMPVAPHASHFVSPKTDFDAIWWLTPTHAMHLDWISSRFGFTEGMSMRKW